MFSVPLCLKTHIDSDALVARYADPAYWSKVLEEENESPLG
jgi:hypothetical protein